MKVLIADDEQLMREGIVSSIDWKSYGFTKILTAKDGIEVLLTAELSEIDLIITDINMPNLNGFDMFEKVKKLLPNVQLIIMSGYDNTEWIKKALQLKAIDYLFKPIDLNELNSCIKKASMEIQNIKSYNKNLYYSTVLNSQNQCSNNEDILLSLESFNDLDISSFTNSLNLRNTDEILIELDNIIKRLNSIDSELIIKLVCCNIILACRENLHENGGCLTDIFNEPLDRLKDIVDESTKEETFKNLKITVSEILNYREELIKNIFSIDIKKADDYIQKHYNNVGLTMQEVAKSVNMSGSYFSAFFKKHKGINFINYLTLVRIEQSKKLLINTPMKIYEISESIGYDNPTYFATVFRKLENCSPVDYRKIHGFNNL